MIKTNRPPVILLVSNNQEIIQSTRKTLKNSELLTLAEDKVSSRVLSKALVKTQPDLVLLDFDNLKQPFYLVYKLSTEYPMFPSIVILPESKKDRADRVVQAGASATMFFPFTAPEEWLGLIGEHVNFSKNAETPPKTNEAIAPMDHPANTFAVFSPKGGAGCTTIATNLAITLHKTLKEEVLLIDGKHLFGHVALYLNLLTGNSMTDLIGQAGMLDQQLINQVVIRHKSGIHVLPSPNSVEGAQGINPEDLFNVLQDLQDAFPNIVIDAGNHLNENTVTYLDASDKVLLVLNPELASMRDAKQFMEIASQLTYPKDKILLILNLMGKKEELKREEIENVLQVKLSGKIPMDEDIALSSVNEGIPIVIRKPRHPISKAISDLVDELDFLIQTKETEWHEENPNANAKDLVKSTEENTIS
jgi:pilus assembly protein CpaE